MVGAEEHLHELQKHHLEEAARRADREKNHRAAIDGGDMDKIGLESHGWWRDAGERYSADQVDAGHRQQGAAKAQPTQQDELDDQYAEGSAEIVESIDAIEESRSTGLVRIAAEVGSEKRHAGADQGGRHDEYAKDGEHHEDGAAVDERMDLPLQPASPKEERGRERSGIEADEHLDGPQPA